MHQEFMILKLGITKSELCKLLGSRTRREISDSFGVSERTLDRIIRDNHLGRPNYGRKMLSGEVVEEIRKAYWHSDCTQQDLSKKFKISQSLVSKIINNKSHKVSHLKISGEASAHMRIKNGN